MQGPGLNTWHHIDLSTYTATLGPSILLSPNSTASPGQNIKLSDPVDQEFLEITSRVSEHYLEPVLKIENSRVANKIDFEYADCLSALLSHCFKLQLKIASGDVNDDKKSISI